MMTVMKLFIHFQDLPDHLVRESPFIVVPSHDLHKIAIHYPRHSPIHDRSIWTFDYVRGNERLVRDLKYRPVRRSIGLFAEDFVDFLRRCITRGKECDVRDRPDPIMALMTTMASITMVSVTSPTKPQTAAAAISIRIVKSVNCRNSMPSTVLFFSPQGRSFHVARDAC